MADQVAEALERLAGARRQAARRRRGPAAGLRALRRARVDARACSTRSSTSGSTTSRSRASPSATENERFAWDSYRRFVQMFGNVSRGIAGRGVRGGDQGGQAGARRRGRHRARRRRAQGAHRDASRTLYKEHTGEDFPQDPQEQLRLAIRAVFDSWTGDRAVAYRRINRIPDDWGTAVNVQQMVFGNKGDTSGSGVAFSRDEVTGAPEPSGDFLLNAQGEDVVSGVRTPRDIAEMKDVAARGARAADGDPARRSSSHYEDMQDTEFTVEEGQLYMLQTRNAKRPGAGRGALRASTPSTRGCSTREEALTTIDAELARRAAAPDLRPQGRLRGARHAASPPRRAPPRARSCSPPRRPSQAAAGGPRRDPRAARSPRPTTSPASTPPRASSPAEGGKASHAALVARGMGRPAVVGAGELKIDLEARTISRRRHDGRTRAT